MALHEAPPPCGTWLAQQLVLPLPLLLLLPLLPLLPLVLLLVLLRYTRSVLRLKCRFQRGRQKTTR